MFKVIIKQVDLDVEEKVVIHCHEITDEVMGLVQKLRNNESIIIGSCNGETYQLNPKDVFYIESVDNKTFLYCQNNVYESKLRLYELEDRLKDTKLFRCSKSMILNIGKIRSVSPSVNGRFEAKLTNGEIVIISRQYVPVLKKKLGM